jgi:hypothetical protein
LLFPRLIEVLENEINIRKSLRLAGVPKELISEFVNYQQTPVTDFRLKLETDLIVWLQTVNNEPLSAEFFLKTQDSQAPPSLGSAVVLLDLENTQSKQYVRSDI